MMSDDKWLVGVHSSCPMLVGLLREVFLSRLKTIHSRLQLASCMGQVLMLVGGRAEEGEA